MRQRALIPLSRQRKRYLLSKSYASRNKKQICMDRKKREKTKKYAHDTFLEMLNNGDKTIADILNDYMETREGIDLLMDGALDAIEDYKSAKR